MIYKLKCPSCLGCDDYNMAMNDVDAVVPCEFCGAEVSRKTCRVWEPTFQIQGDTVPGGCSYDYWDGNLGVRVKGKRHRQDEMKRQGLREYAPDPEMKKYRDEARYVKSHASAADPDARAAVRAINKEAGNVRRRRNIERVFDSIPVPDIKLD